MKDARPFLFPVLILLVLLPIVIFGWYLCSFTVNVPYWDQWYEVFYLQKFMANSLSAGDLFTQQVDTRPVFPTLIAVALGALTHFDVRYETAVIFLLFSLTFILLLYMYLKDHGFSTTSMALFLPVSWFFFNLTLIGNFVWGIYISHVLAVFALFCAIVLLDGLETPGVRFFSAVGAACVASFSFVGGLYVWPACGALLLLQDGKKKYRLFTAWVVFSALIFTAYFWDYRKPQVTPSFLYFLSSPVKAAFAFVTSAGSSVVHDPVFAPFAGIAVLCIFAGLLFRNREDLSFARNGKWIALILFSLLISAGVVFARAGWGTYIGLSLRYFPVTFPAVIGIYCMALNYAKISPAGPGVSGSQPRGPGRKRLINLAFLVVAGAFLVAGVFVHAGPGLDQGIGQKELFLNASYLLGTYQFQSDETLSMICPDTPYLLKETAFLQKNRLSVFASGYPDISALPRLNGTALCAIEEIDGIPVTSPDPLVIPASGRAGIGIRGWAVGGPDWKADAVFISLNDRIEIPARYPVERDDIAAGDYDPGNRNSGFSAYFSPGLLEEGENNLSITIAGPEGYVRSGPVRIVVSGGVI
jgi:hypothetical protein